MKQDRHFTPSLVPRADGFLPLLYKRGLLNITTEPVPVSYSLLFVAQLGPFKFLSQTRLYRHNPSNTQIASRSEGENIWSRPDRKGVRKGSNPRLHEIGVDEQPTVCNH